MESVQDKNDDMTTKDLSKPETKTCDSTEKLNKDGKDKTSLERQEELNKDESFLLASSSSTGLFSVVGDGDMTQTRHPQMINISSMNAQEQTVAGITCHQTVVQQANVARNCIWSVPWTDLVQSSDWRVGLSLLAPVAVLQGVIKKVMEQTTLSEGDSEECSSFRDSSFSENKTHDPEDDHMESFSTSTTRMLDVQNLIELDPAGTSFDCLKEPDADIDQMSSELEHVKISPDPCPASSSFAHSNITHTISSISKDASPSSRFSVSMTDVAEAGVDSSSSKCLLQGSVDADNKNLRSDHTAIAQNHKLAPSISEKTGNSISDTLASICSTKAMPDVTGGLVKTSLNSLEQKCTEVDENRLQSDITASRRFSCMSHTSVQTYVGGKGTFISDDAIEAAIRIMRFMVQYGKFDVHVGNFLPSEQQVALVTPDKNRTYLPEDKESINILLVDRASHWVTVCFCPGSRKILLYDSLEDQLRPSQILPLLQKMYQGISLANIEYIPITQQPPDDPACGAFAVASAFSKLIGQDPEDQDFIVSHMRKHLKRCLEEGRLVTFPTRTRSEAVEEVNHPSRVSTNSGTSLLKPSHILTTKDLKTSSNSLFDMVFTPSRSDITKALQLMQSSENFYIADISKSVTGFIPEDKIAIVLLLVQSFCIVVTVDQQLKKVGIYDSKMYSNRSDMVWQMLTGFYPQILDYTRSYVLVTPIKEGEPVNEVLPVACCYSLFLGHDPEERQFDVDKMEEHLEKCLLKQEVIPFPTAGARCLYCGFNKNSHQHYFQMSLEIVSCNFSPGKVSEVLKTACGLVNSNKGGKIRIRNLDFNPKFEGPPGVDNFHHKIDDSLQDIIYGTGTSYADTFRWEWENDNGEFYNLHVKAVEEICSVDFKAKASLPKGRAKEDRAKLLSLLKESVPESCEPDVSTCTKNFIIDAFIPEIAESVNIQLKCYEGKKPDRNSNKTTEKGKSKAKEKKKHQANEDQKKKTEDEKLKSKLEDDLRGYLSAFAKVENGGQVFVGLEEIDEKDRKWEKGYIKGTGKLTRCKGQVVEDTDNIKQYIDHLILEGMCWLRSDGSVACEEDVKKYVRTTFHPVLNSDGQQIDKTYVIEISIAKLHGIVFTSGRGPEAMKITQDGSLHTLTVVEWWSEMLGKDFKELQRKLVELYNEKCSKVEVSPLDGINIPIDKIYTEVVIVEETVADLEKQGEKKQIEKELPSFKDIFFKGKDRRKNIAILGPAGRGKTTWCRQLANLWSKVHGAEQILETGKDHVFEEESLIDYIDSCMFFGTRVYLMSDYFVRKQQEQFEKCEIMRHFEYLFLIQLRLLEKPISVYDAICSTLLNDYSDLNETIKKVLKKYPEKVLVICDGLDEYCHKKPPSREHLHGCTVLTTTRSWQYESIRRSCDKPDIVLQLKGFDEFGVVELTKNILMHLNGIEGKNKAIEFLNEIRSVGLLETAKIPLILTYLVHLWYNTKNKLSKSLTVNLIELLVCIIGKGEEKIEDMPDVSKLKDKLSKVKLPGKLYNETELKPFGALLLCIAELAFQGLILSDTKNSLIFRGRNLMKHFQDDSELEVCLKFGLLSKSEIIYDGRKSTAVSFYHKLVQEFFTAVYAVFSEDAFEKLCQFCCTLDGVFDSENIYLFICGIDPQVGAKFSKHVAEVMSMDTNVKRWRKEIVKNSVSPDYEFGWCTYSDKVDRMTILNTSCLKEIDHSNKRSGQTFYVTDVCFIPYFISNLYSKPKDFLYLLCNAIQTVVYLQIGCVDLTKQEGEMLVQVICESPSLQTVGLCRIKIDGTTEVTYQVHNVKSNTSSSSVLQSVHLKTVPASLSFALIKHLRRATTVTQQENNGSSVACVGGLTTGSTGTLTKLILSSITMTGCEWDMLMNIVSESPSLQTLELWKITVDGCLYVGRVCIGTSSHSAELYNIHVPLLALLTFVRRITTVPQQDNSTSSTHSNVDSVHYLRVNNVTMARCEWDMLVNIVSESPSLQNLKLSDVTINDKDDGDNVPMNEANTNTSSHSVLQHVDLSIVSAPLLPLLTCVRSTTTVTQQDNSGSDDAISSGLTSVTSGTLTNLSLCGIMTICEWDMLVNIVIESPSLQTLVLRNITINDKDDGDNVPVYEANTNTSSHSVLQSVELWEVSAPLLPLLTHLRSTMNVTQLDNIGSDGACSSGPTSVTSGTLTNLSLCGIRTICEWDMLVNIVIESPSLQTLVLRNITINDKDDGDNVPVYEANTNTSSHSVLQSVELWEVSAPLLPQLTPVSNTTVTKESSCSDTDSICSGNDCTGNSYSENDCTHSSPYTPVLYSPHPPYRPTPFPFYPTYPHTFTFLDHHLSSLDISNVIITRDEWNILMSIFRFCQVPIIIDEEDASDNVTVYDLHAYTFTSPRRHVVLRQVRAPMLQLLTCFSKLNVSDSYSKSDSDFIS